jgi:hypothetical protein
MAFEVKLQVTITKDGNPFFDQGNTWANVPYDQMNRFEQYMVGVLNDLASKGEVGGEWGNQVARKHHLLYTFGRDGLERAGYRLFESTSAETALGQRLGNTLAVGKQWRSIRARIFKGGTVDGGEPVAAIAVAENHAWNNQSALAGRRVSEGNSPESQKPTARQINLVGNLSLGNQCKPGCRKFGETIWPRSGQSSVFADTHNAFTVAQESDRVSRQTLQQWGNVAGEFDRDNAHGCP